MDVGHALHLWVLSHVVPGSHTTDLVCRYFRTILYKNGVMNTEEASLMNKMYRFGASSTCFKYLRQFFYTGCIAGVPVHLDDGQQCRHVTMHLNHVAYA